MRTTRTTVSTIALGALVLAAGCASGGHQPGEISADGAAHLWAMTCSHCHTLRPADQYAAEDWPVIVQHMRTRSGITDSEAEAISRMLQSLAER